MVCDLIVDTDIVVSKTKTSQCFLSALTARRRTFESRYKSSMISGPSCESYIALLMTMPLCLITALQCQTVVLV